MTPSLRPFSHFILLAALFPAMGAFAGGSPPTADTGDASCEAQLLTRPAVIEPTPTRLFPIELRKTGRLFRAGEPLPPLDESGLYHYLITASDEILLTPSYVGRRLATHKSLVGQYTELSRGREPEVVAAGDMIIAFGQLMFMDNRSGNFRGGPQNLHYAAQVLRQAGLPFASDADIHLHDPVKDLHAKGHTPEGRRGHQMQIDLRQEIKKSLHGPELVALYERLGRSLNKALGAPTPNKMVYDVIDVKKTITEFMTFTNFIYPLQSALTVDGLYFGIKRAQADIGQGRLGPIAAHQIRFLVTALESRLTPSDRAELSALAEDFERLGPPTP